MSTCIHGSVLAWLHIVIEPRPYDPLLQVDAGQAIIELTASAPTAEPKEARFVAEKESLPLLLRWKPWLTRPSSASARAWSWSLRPPFPHRYPRQRPSQNRPAKRSIPATPNRRNPSRKWNGWRDVSRCPKPRQPFLRSSLRNTRADAHHRLLQAAHIGECTTATTACICKRSHLKDLARRSRGVRRRWNCNGVFARQAP